MRRFSLAVIALVEPSSAPAWADHALRYSCEDGTVLTVRFLGKGSEGSRAVIRFADQSRALALPQADSADGGRYADGRTVFWIKGRSATLTRPGKPQTTCSTQ